MYFKSFLLLCLAVQFSSCNVYVPTLYPRPPSLYPLYSSLPSPVPRVYTPVQTVVPSVQINNPASISSTSSSVVTPSPLSGASTYSGWNCNELERKLNDERRRYGLKPLLCDQHMRWVADQHLKDQHGAGFDGFNLPEDSTCNLHSWFTKFSCCYDGSDGSCVWDKPYQLSKWDKRSGYEISAAYSCGAGCGISPSQAFKQWQSSPGHYAQFMGRTHNGNDWSGIKTMGCAWKNNLAHCWFAEEFPSTYP